MFADFDEPRIGDEDEPAEIPIGHGDALGHEWAVVVDAPGYAACLVGWETPTRDGERIFEAVWTMDAPVVRRAAQVGAALAARSAPEWSERLLGMLADRPLAVEAPAPGLTALTNRMIGYLESASRLLRPRDPVDRPLEHLTADDEADLRQLARRADRGRDELGAGRRAERLAAAERQRARCTRSGGQPGVHRAARRLRRRLGGGASAAAPRLRLRRGAARPMRSGRLAGAFRARRSAARAWHSLFRFRHAASSVRWHVVMRR